MPGRVVSAALSGQATPGPQVMPMQAERPVPAVRRSTHNFQTSDADKILPGLIDREDGQAHLRSQGNSYLTSTTQLDRSSDAVLQQGAEERRRYMTANFAQAYRSPGQPPKPVSTVRPQSAMAVSSPSTYTNGSTFAERPPSSLGVAWGSSQKFFNGNKSMDGGGNPESLESRLKTLMNDSNPRQPMNAVPNGQLHYDESDLILPVHQRSHSYGDGVTLGQGYNGIHYSGERSEDVYAVVAKRQDRVNGYVPSQPHERREPARPESQASMRYRTQSGASYTSLDNREQDNLAFVSDSPHKLQDPSPRGPSAAASNDLRSAWQRLYGNRPDHVASSSRRPSAEDIMDSRKTPTMEDPSRHQNARLQNTHQASPQATHPHNSSPNSHEPIWNGNMAGSVPASISRLPNNSARPKGTVANHKIGSSDTPYGSAASLTHQQSSSFTHHQTVPSRESPTGQSSSNPEQFSGSNDSSQLSSYSVTNRNISTFKPESSGGNKDPAIGPASKYPETQMSGRSSAQTPVHLTSQDRNVYDPTRTSNTRLNMASPQFVSDPVTPRRQRMDSSTSDIVEFTVRDNLPRPQSRKGSSFLDSDEDLADEYHLKPLDSIFDYREDSEHDSVTPPLPPLSPSITSRGSGRSTPTNMIPTFPHSTSAVTTSSRSPHRTPDLIRPPSKTNSRPHAGQAGGSPTRMAEKKGRSHLSVPVKEERKLRSPHDGGFGGHARHSISSYARSRSLEDVRESGNESTLSFDVENTMLTVEPSDQSEMGTLPSQKGSSVRAQLTRLEGMYTHVMKTLEENAHGTRTKRRWSIGSSDTSSLRHPTHQSRHRSNAHRMSSKDVRSIGKRFQRLESHVITLARSVAHLSSELRSQNTLSREIENVKREMQELKTQGPATPLVPGNFVGGNRLMSDYERYRGWVPSLTNPRRVNKLTKFFGQEPPLLEIFLKRLGYEKFLKNFEEEHIGMIELPYMTEDRLQSIGIPMGPRLRILQEAQMCFRQGNFDIYFV